MKYNILEKNRSGIYIIRNSVDLRFYIGSSKNLYKRYKYHLEDLVKNKHGNRHLQNFCNKYGIDKLSFELLEYCDIDILLEREQYFLDNYNISVVKFNLAKTARGGFEKHSEEAKRNMSIRRRGVKISPMSDEGKKNISIAVKNSPSCQAHLSKIQQANVKTYLFIDKYGMLIVITNLKKFCEKNNLSDTKMVAVYNGKRFSHKGWKKFGGRNRKTPSHYRDIYKYTLDGVFVGKYSSLVKACKSVGTTNERAISDCANFKRTDYKGFIWLYEMVDVFSNQIDNQV